VRVAISGRYRVNNALAIRETLLLAGGIALCPAWLVRDLLDSGGRPHGT
jgi:DNA-binding transcriptional LysR family regulator